MKIELTPKEIETFKLLANSELGRSIEEMILKMIRTVESVRTEIDLTPKERIAVANCLEINFINRFKVSRGEAIENAVENYE